MGTDIHLFVETRTGRRWVSADHWERDDDGTLRYHFVSRENRFYSGRNYDLFAILADVRNGYGFAGTSTGDKFRVISPPKGLPADVSMEVKSCSDWWGQNGHSHSWLTLAEILAFNWTQTTTQRGYVDALTFWRWDSPTRDEGEGPDMRIGAVWSQDAQIIPASAMRQRLDAIAAEATDDLRERIEDELANVFCQITWETPYHYTVKEFWWRTIPRLLHLGKPDNVRIVFWFDN